MGGGNPELKTELQGNGWRKGKKMLIPPAGEDDRTISGWALKQGTSAYETRDFGVSNHGVREVKDRTSGCERRDFSRSCRVFAGLKGYKEMSLYIYIYINIFILRCRIEPQWTENLYKPLIINGLYWAIDCTVFIWCEMSDLEPVSIFLNNNLIAASLTVPSAESNANS
mgnify:CR=1 FL=1